MVKHATGLPLSQLNANVSLECHSDHFKCHSIFANSWDPVSIVQDSSQVWLLGRFPIYRETTEEPDLRWTNPLSFDANKSRLAQVKDRKGTPFENFRRELSTNGKPAFWALDQWEASILARFSVLAKSGVYQSNANVPIDWQANVSWLSTECKWTTKGMSINFQLNANWIPIKCQLTTN